MADLEQRMYNGDQARQVLENDAFNQAFDDIKAEILEQWTNSPVRDQEGREQLYKLLRLADKLKATLTQSLEDGKMAKLDYQHQEKQSMLQRARQSLGV